jgi:hypothetical protein
MKVFVTFSLGCKNGVPNIIHRHRAWPLLIQSERVRCSELYSNYFTSPKEGKYITDFILPRICIVASNYVRDMAVLLKAMNNTRLTIYIVQFQLI